MKTHNAALSSLSLAFCLVYSRVFGIDVQYDWEMNFIINDTADVWLAACLTSLTISVDSPLQSERDYSTVAKV